MDLTWGLGRQRDSKDYRAMLGDFENNITYFAKTNFRNEAKPFGIKRADRRAHMYVIGKTGTGKSSLLETLIREDIKNGEGLALLDPHGDLIEKVLKAVPEERKVDLIYFNVATAKNPLGFSCKRSLLGRQRSTKCYRRLRIFTTGQVKRHAIAKHDHLGRIDLNNLRCTGRRRIAVYHFRLVELETNHPDIRIEICLDLPSSQKRFDSMPSLHLQNVRLVQRLASHCASQTHRVD